MIRTALLFLIGLTSSIYLHAQTYSDCANINDQDSSLLGCFKLLDNGHVVTASTMENVQTTSGSSVPGNIAFGPTAIRELDRDGQTIWEYVIDGGALNLMDIKVAPNGDLLACGSFVDSLNLEGEHYECSEFHANAILICLDSDGNYRWSRSLDPVMHRSSYYHDIAIYDGKVYLPYINAAAGPLRSFVQVYDMDGDSVDHIQLSSGAMIISEFEIDEAGQVYIAGTGGHTDIGGATLGKDSPVFSYLSFIAKLDKDFNQLWSHTFRYVTFDFYPRLAYNRDKVVFFVDTMPQVNGIGNHHILKYYDHDGNALRSDSVGPTFFSKMHNYMDIVAVNKGFVFSTVKNFKDLSVQYVDRDYNYSEIALVELNPGSSYPSFDANDSSIIYAYNYLGTHLVVNETDSLYNSKYMQPYYRSQQVLIRFEYENEVLLVQDPSSTFVRVYPNPSMGLYKIENPGRDVHYSVRDIHGRILRSGTLDRISVEIDLCDQPTGMYILQLSDGRTIKLMKQ